MPEGIQLRQVRYLNNMVEQDHRFIKKRVRSMLEFKSYKTTASILSDLEDIYINRKNQTHQRMNLIFLNIGFCTRSLKDIAILLLQK